MYTYIFGRYFLNFNKIIAQLGLRTLLNIDVTIYKHEQNGPICQEFKNMTHHLSRFTGGRSPQTIDKMMSDRKHFVFCQHKNRLISVLYGRPIRNSEKPDLKTHAYLHILLSQAILKDTDGIVNISGPSKLKNRITNHEKSLLTHQGLSG